MRLVLLGAPGSGKGTQGQVLADHFGVAHISSGDLLRSHVAAGTPLGREVARYMEAGQLVPDDLVIDIAVADALRAAASTGGYLLDGFPRTLAQAKRAYEIARPSGLTASAVVYLAVPDDEVRRRLAARAAEQGRRDDTAEVIDHRLEVFHAETEPLLRFYEGRGILHSVDATGPPEAVTAAILKELADVEAQGESSLTEL